MYECYRYRCIFMWRLQHYRLLLSKWFAIAHYNEREHHTAKSREGVGHQIATQYTITSAIKSRCTFENDDKLISDINQTFSFLRTHYPNISIVWRNTPPGLNFRASVFRPPLTTPPLVIPRRYHWDEFDRQNTLVRHFLHTYYPETLVLDVATPSSLRQDAHYDELHYCIPGPVGLWVDLLFSALQLISTFKT